MDPFLALGVIAFAAAVSLAIYRLRRGWETRGDVLWMMAALAVIGGLVTSLDGSAGEAVIGSLAWAIGGGWWYLIERPVSPPGRFYPQGPRTEEQRRLDRWLDRAMGLAVR
jgi:hypothetical protein